MTAGFGPIDSKQVWIARAVRSMRLRTLCGADTTNCKVTGFCGRPPLQSFLRRNRAASAAKEWRSASVPVCAAVCERPSWQQTEQVRSLQTLPL